MDRLDSDDEKEPRNLDDARPPAPDDIARHELAHNEGFCGDVKATPPASVIRNEPLHRMFRSVEQAFRHQALAQMRQAGVADMFPGAAPLVLHLGEENGLPVSELGKRCGLEGSTMTPLVDELVRQGIAVRERDPVDRRIVRLFLTEHGRALEPRLRMLFVRLQDMAFRGIDAEEMDAMYGVLKRMVANLGEAEPHD